jgi:hypothetical protein
LQNSCAIYYPDYTLQWIPRTDASDYGVGVILIQVLVKPDGTLEYQTIGIASHKFSEVALRWCTIEKEAYAIFYGVKKFSYQLIGKDFDIETDHNNLLWMEASEVPKIIRWRIYLQGFKFMIRHIAGRHNIVADALSRLHMLAILASHPDYLQDNCESMLLNLYQLTNVVYENIDTSSDVDRMLLHFRSLCGMSAIRVKSLDSKAELMPQQVDHNGQHMFQRPTVFDEVSQPPSEVPDEIHAPVEISVTQDEALRAVHCSRSGHAGIAETYTRLNKHFPGHGISMQQVRQFVDTCANCQKTRRERSQALIPAVRHLKPPHSRSAIGIDGLAITPPGSKGETHILVIVNLYTKLVFLEPSTGCTSFNLAKAVWKYWCTYGHTDMVISDRGTDFSSELFEELVKYVGMRHVFSITDKHSNGTERSNKEVLRHLRAIVYDERVKNVFDDPMIIPSVQYIMNSQSSSENSDKELSPFELTFGTQDKLYANLSNCLGGDPTQELLSRLNDNLATLRAVSSEYQKKLAQARVSEGPAKPNQYQPGDLVMFDTGPKPNPKMSTRFKGPHEVVYQSSNDVQCRNLITGAILTYSLEDLEPFHGTREVAYEAALRDKEQFVVERVSSYRGDCNSRKKMYFTLHFADGDIRELPWTPDIQCEAYYDFCASRPYLYHLTLDAILAKKFISTKRKEDIVTLSPGENIYVDLRAFGDDSYEALGLPDWQTTSYVIELRLTHWFHKSSKKKISAKLALGKATYALDAYWVYAWGYNKTFDTAKMIIVDEAMLNLYPSLLEKHLKPRNL